MYTTYSEIFQEKQKKTDGYIEYIINNDNYKNMENVITWRIWVGEGYTGIFSTVFATVL